MSYFSGISMDKVPIAESFKAVMGNFFLVITNNLDNIQHLESIFQCPDIETHFPQSKRH